MATANPDHTVISVDSSNNQSKYEPRIQRVPSILREITENRRCYEPMVVSIGPFHHGRSGTELLEQLKIEHEKQFISDIGSDRYPSIYRNFDEVAKKAMECYDFGSSSRIPNDDFKRMMFRDGCFILHFIHCMVENKPGNTKMKSDQRAFVLRDLFLLENQLPFIILKELMSSRFSKAKTNDLITKFIRSQTAIPSNRELQEDNLPLHLLDLFRNELVHVAPSMRPLFRNIWPPPRPRDGATAAELEGWHSFRAVTELKASGIECKRSTTCCLKDVKFKTGIIKGNLLLPPIIIDDSTKPKLLNLVAYDTCPDAPDDFTVTSYICFMDSLIDSAEDVKELRSKGILLNVLGSDQQVISLTT